MRRPVLALVIVLLLATSTAAFRGVRRTVVQHPTAAAALPFGPRLQHEHSLRTWGTFLLLASGAGLVVAAGIVIRVRSGSRGRS